MICVGCGKESPMLHPGGVCAKCREVPIREQAVAVPRQRKQRAKQKRSRRGGAQSVIEVLGSIETRIRVMMMMEEKQEKKEAYRDCIRLVQSHNRMYGE